MGHVAVYRKGTRNNSFKTQGLNYEIDHPLRKAQPTTTAARPPPPQPCPEPGLQRVASDGGLSAHPSACVHACVCARMCVHVCAQMCVCMHMCMGRHTSGQGKACVGAGFQANRVVINFTCEATIKLLQRNRK